MKKARKKPPEIVVREGKPVAVMLDIADYQNMVECLGGGDCRYSE